MVPPPEREKLKTHPWTAVGSIAGVAALIVTMITLWPGWQDDPAPPCSTEQRSGPTDPAGRLKAPTGVRIEWTRSPTAAGRVAAAVYWVNNDDRTTQGLLEVTGRFGKRDANDLTVRVDGRELPREGLCGNWYRRYTQPDDGERGEFFDRLWANDDYCFAPNASNAAGGTRSPYPSLQSDPVCERAPWHDSWGDPDQP
jgi:hypothetical protein